MDRESWIGIIRDSRFTIHDSWTIRDGADKNESCVGKGASSKAPGYSRLWLCDSWLMHVMTSAEDVLKKIHSLFVICNHESRITNYTPRPFVFTIANRHSINDSWFRTKFCHNLESPIVNITDPRSLCKLARLGSNKAAEQEAVLAFWIVNGLRSSPLWSANHESNHEGIWKFSLSRE